MFALILLQAAYAEEQSIDYPVKQGNCVRLTQTCSNCTWINITSIAYPNQSYAINGEIVMARMSAGSTSWYYDYCNNSELGEYTVSGHANLDGINKIWNFRYTVNLTGDDRGYWTIIILLVASFLVLCLSAYTRNEYIGFIAGCLFLVTGIYIMKYGMNNVADIYTRTISYAALGFGILLSVISGYEALSGWGEG